MLPFIDVRDICIHMDPIAHISCLCLAAKSFLVWQILEDPSPSPSKLNFSPEFCSFINACLQKDADARPTAEQVSK